MKFAPWLAASLLLVGTALHADQPTDPITPIAPDGIDGTTITDEMAIGQEDSGDRLTVAVSVGGQGPYRFLVDTGSERTVISRQLANRLQLAAGKTMTLHSMIGVSSVATVLIPQLRVSNSSLSVANAPALEANNIGADGLLGIDSLKSQRVLFDFKAKTMSVSPAYEREERYDGETIIVRAKSRRGHLIFTHARIDGAKVLVIVDTGSQFTVGNMALYRKLLKRRSASVQSVTIHSVTGEKVVANVANLRKVDLGDVHLTDLATAFTDAHIFRKLDMADRPALLLGMNAMRAFDKISIDFKSKKVRFVLPSAAMADDIRMAEASVRK